MDEKKVSDLNVKEFDELVRDAVAAGMKPVVKALQLFDEKECAEQPLEPLRHISTEGMLESIK